MASDFNKTIYKPGQAVPTAGIYKVSHAHHRLPHKATFKANETFPTCHKCDTAVRFELLNPVEEEEAERRSA